MKIEEHFVPIATLEDFADDHRLVMEVHERTKRYYCATNDFENNRYYAHFKNADTTDGYILSSVTGNGPTPEAAIADYAIRISEQLLVIDASTEKRREIVVPRLTK